MISFFRKIRQQLFSSQKISNYFLYAFGEITLVVIGILIALQINNWNQDQKDKAFEEKKLLELIEDLVLDSTYLQTQFNRIDNFERSVDILLTNPKRWEDIEEKDIKLFGGVYFVQNNKTVESLKNSDVQVPLDDALRKKISSHYHNSRFLLDLISLEDKNFFELRAIPLQKSDFRIIRTPSSEYDIDFEPIDFNKTQNSTAYQDYLLIRKSKINRWRGIYTRIYENTLECKKAIEKYLQQ